MRISRRKIFRLHSHDWQNIFVASLYGKKLLFFSGHRSMTNSTNWTFENSYSLLNYLPTSEYIRK